ncbi:MAG TPA: hypothetical protein VEK08_13700 [Planctomycetota bacterium]|nr:hypothetical protein [Planctomycetota bacterium]
MSNRRFLRRHSTWACVLFLLAACAVSAEEAPAPALPKDVDALPADLSTKMKQLIRSAEKYRGLQCKHPVACGSLGKEGLRKKMLQAFEEELPEAKMNPLEASLKAFGFIPETMQLSKYYPELLTSQVGGFYDPRRKYLVIVQNEGGVLGKEAKEQYGEMVAERMEQTVMVHELVHAIQDQHFDLQKFTIDDPLSDEAAARTALIEGDATLAMYNFFSGVNLETMPGVEKLMSQFFDDPKQLMDMAPEMPGSKEMAAAPAWFRDNLLFSYMQGFTFCMSVKKLGGQKLLDHAFTKEPPRSTEQILHPEKYHTKRDDPIEIAWPDLSADLAGFTKIREGQLGEQSIKVLLRDKINNDPQATLAAAGWGGDRFAVYHKNGNRVLLWITEWDSNEDAKQFKEAAEKLGNDWTFESPAPSRVIAIRGKLTGEELAAAKGKLAAAKATAPANKGIDLAALGIDPKKPAAGGDDLLSNLQKLLGEGKGDDIDLGDLLKNDKLQEAMKKLGGDAGGLDIGQMMKDPQMQNLMKSLLSQERPKGGVSEDGRTYKNETLGLQITLPEAQKDWKFDPNPPPPLGALLTDAKNGAQLSIMTQTLPIAMPIDSIGPMLEMGPKMAMQNYKKISSGAIETSGKKGFQLQYEGDSAGLRLRSIQNVYVIDATMIVVSALAPVDKWEAVEKPLKQALDALKFVAPAPKKDTPAKKEELKEE